MENNNNIEFMLNLLIQRISLIEQVNHDILRTQIKEQEMITGLNSSVNQLKISVKAISMRQNAKGGGGGGDEGALRSSLNSKY